MQELRDSDTNCTVARKGDFLKTVCSDVDSKTKYYFKCINSYETYTEYWNGKGREFWVSHICDNDNYAYQSCNNQNEINRNRNPENVLCGGYHCVDTENKPRFKSCDRNKNCFVSRVCPPDQEIPLKLNFAAGHDAIVTRCDQKCDERNERCEDESNCNGYTYGIKCSRTDGDTRLVAVSEICNGRADCVEGEDERDCEVTNSTLHSCTRDPRDTWHLVSEIEAPIFDFIRCSAFYTVDAYNNDNIVAFDSQFEVFPYCKDYSDQTNCTDVERIGGHCLVNGFMSSISIYVVCDSEYLSTDEPFKICDDDLEKACTTPSSEIPSGCKIHKHRLCDDVSDCPNGGDEASDSCILKMENYLCNRTFNPAYNGASIPITWIMDNETDCENGGDEKEDEWIFCENIIDHTSFVRSSRDKCQNVFICSDNMTTVKPQVLCDGIESCGETGNENAVCQIARDFPVIKTSAIQINSTRDLCADREDFLNLACKIAWFMGPPDAKPVLGVSTRLKLNIPTTEVDCSNQFGEYYVYFSCMGLCLHYTTCPLLNNHLKHDSCPNQFPGRVYTLADNSYLTFAVKTDKHEYQQNFFECNNRRCVDYSKMCDLINDCGDLSDEENCFNHMVCQNTANDGSMKHLIALKQRCDGIFDCFDLSDECNDHCGKRILGNWVLSISCWLMGILATGMNFFTVFIGVRQLGKCETCNMLMTRILACLIGCGDLLIGIYLIGLSIYNSVIFGNDFCTHQIEWLTGAGCAALGIISTVGSQLSLFSMTILSIDRMSGLIRNSVDMTPPRRVNKNTILKAFLLTTGTVMVSLTVALIPLVPSLQDYFVQGMHYETDLNYNLFIGFPDKARHIRVLQEYYNTTDITTDITWNEIAQKVDEMFSQNYETMSRRAVHFYGNDGICLFKYFVRRDDPRRSRAVVQNVTDIGDYKGDAVVWLILCLNLTCFFVITVCYVIINIQTRRSSERSGASQNESVIDQNRTIQNRISAIIATDFLSWVPFSLICALHNLQAIDATDWYVNLSMIVLPINSVINPFLYDNTLKYFMINKLRNLTTGVAMTNSDVMTRTQQICSEQNANQIEMEAISTLAKRSMGQVRDLANDHQLSLSNPSAALRARLGSG